MGEEKIKEKIKDIIEDVKMMPLKLPEDSEFKDCLQDRLISPGMKLAIHSIAHFHDQLKKQMEEKPFSDDAFLKGTPYLTYIIPSRSIVSVESHSKTRFDLDFDSKITSNRLGDERTSCTFMTGNSRETIYPEKIKSIRTESNKVIVDVTHVGGSELLKFYINLDPDKAIKFYYHLFNHLESVKIVADDKTLAVCKLNPCYHDSPVQMVSDEFFSGFQTLYDFDSFQERFMFFNISHRERINVDDYSVIFTFKELPFEITDNDLLLNCISILNTYQSDCEPIVKNLKEISYPIVVNNNKSESEKVMNVLCVESSEKRIVSEEFRLIHNNLDYDLILEDDDFEPAVYSPTAICCNGHYPNKYINPGDELHSSLNDVDKITVLTKPTKVVAPRKSNFSTFTKMMHFLLDTKRFHSVENLKSVIDLMLDGKDAPVLQTLKQITRILEKNTSRFEEGKMVNYDICEIFLSEDFDPYRCYLHCRLIHQIFVRFCELSHKHRTEVFVENKGIVWIFENE